MAAETPVTPPATATLPLEEASHRLRRPPGRPRKHPLIGHVTVTPAQEVRVTPSPEAGPRVAQAPAPQPPALAPRLLSVKAAAAYLSVSPWLIRRLLEEGALHAVTLARSRRVLIDRHALDALVDASREG